MVSVDGTQTGISESIGEAAAMVRQLKGEIAAARRRQYEIAVSEVEALQAQLGDAVRELRHAEGLLAASQEVDRAAVGPVEMEAVCKYYGVTEAQVRGHRKQGLIVEARHELMRRLRDDHEWMLKEIGLFVGGRDHSSVIHGVRRARARLVEDQAADGVRAVV